jgi:hypothetical protein
VYFLAPQRRPFLRTLESTAELLARLHAGRHSGADTQLGDAYTFNFDYIGSRATGNGGGSYLIAGPDWKGETPQGVQKVIRAETELVLAPYYGAQRSRKQGARRAQERAGAAALPQRLERRQ